MAQTKRHRTLVNPARKRRNPKRKMSAKQIKHFGTKAQKAALKRRKDKREGRCRDLPIAVPAPSASKPGVLESLIAVYPKPASMDTKVLLAWYNAISTLHGALS